MQAVVFDEGRVTTGEVDDPVATAHEVLVAVQSAGLNGADLLQLQGRYPPPPGVRADLPGLEFAGRVVEVGSGVTRFSLGDAVMGIVAGAGQAERVVIHERVAMPVPAALPLAVAGGFPEVFLTAYDALVAQAGLCSGERVLVTGAAGGVGTAAVQIAVALGAAVVGAVRSPQQRAVVAALGAEAVDSEEAHARGPYDVVVELVGGTNLAGDLEALAIGGRIVLVGLGAGGSAELDLRRVLARRARLSGATMRSRPLEDKALVARRVEHELLPLVARGTLRVIVDSTFALGDAPAAYERFAAGGKAGKILLAMPGS